MEHRITLNFPNRCRVCNARLAPGTVAMYDRNAPKGMRARHVTCADTGRAQQAQQRDSGATRAEDSSATAARPHAQQGAPRGMHPVDGHARPEIYKPLRTAIWRHESPAALAGALEKYAQSKLERLRGRNGRSSWAERGIDDALQAARTGDETGVESATALIEQIRVAMPDTETRRYVPCVAGAYPIVPEALAGFPLCMRGKRVVEDTRAPVRIVVDITTSADVPADVIQRRGAAIMALAMLVSEQRPVDLLAVSSLDGSGDGQAGYLSVVTLPSRPLELATACYVLTSASFPRHLGYGWIQANGAGNGWAWGVICSTRREREHYAANLRAALGLSDIDVIVPPIYSTDELAATRPVEWINARLAEINAAG